ncbi:glycosyltransferase family protein [Terriglobus albidus]|uniref:hypothetical protein n=1 Tax=Terriglobus albidus TaxID=1592106 RepID=UPI0021E03BE6|nr:hypothetical protein [Terriglobus albidus]
MTNAPSTAIEGDELWAAIYTTLSRFEGDLAFAIRTELFFHLALAAAWPMRFRAKNLAWPIQVLRRMTKKGTGLDTLHAARLLAVCDYAAEPGFGSIRPVVQAYGADAAIIMNAPVWDVRSAEALSYGAPCASIDRGLSALESRGALAFARKWTPQIEQAANGSLRELLRNARFVVFTLLARAFAYRERLVRAIRRCEPSVVLTHNDFTTLSYLAGAVARDAGITDITLQHGLIAPEYLPVSASHYVTWGKFHSEALGRGSPGSTTLFHAIGAPRLDHLSAARRSCNAVAADAPVRLLFLSQMHSPAMRENERETLFQLLLAAAQLPGVELSIRPHPQERTEHRKRYQALRLRLRPEGETLRDAVEQSHAVLSSASTAMLEAALLGVPVLSLPSPPATPVFPRTACNLTELGTAVAALHSREELARWISEQDAAMQRFLVNPGEATGTLLNFLRSLP